MATTWTFAIDWDRNGNFTGDHDDITEDVISARWFLGVHKPYQEDANDSMLELTLNNADQRFSPENSSSPLYGKLASFRPVKITSHDGTTERTMWTGWIESIQPDVGQYGGRRVKITAAGPMQFFKGAETYAKKFRPIREHACGAECKIHQGQSRTFKRGAAPNGG